MDKKEMGIYLDTGNLSIIGKYHKMGLICGVTTNPTILLREGLTSRMKGI
jgi:transaldolase